ncbi:MAG: four helix bundle protein [Chloroflexi bacterium]|nr:four helix bundle protein [Chloroflexota bacterium]
MKVELSSFDAWIKGVHQSIKNDPLWSFQVYPKALFIFDLAWKDCDYLLKDPRGKAVANQLTRSTGSISANIEEGFGRGFGKDYAYKLKIALGEARESRGWYLRGRALLPEELLNHRINLLSEIIAMLPPNIKKQRDYKSKK